MTQPKEMTQERLAELAGPIDEIVWGPMTLLREAHEMATRILALEAAMQTRQETDAQGKVRE